ncbi:PepSY-associated TM helix domain-containing protein [Salinicoccus roseus]|uniref:PepSY-associated TM helix domain-containing protein n=1 Tax=Salinicoccus roseus TaxID=45670 RepID=UPI003DA047AE
MERKKKLIYPAIWRWHFYAGIVIAPLLLVLAVTGGVYLFKHDIEDTLYADYYEVTPSGTPIAAQAQVDAALDEIDGSVMRFRPGESDVRSAEVGIATEQGESFTVFINPYTGEVLGTLNDGHRLMDRIEEIHGELMAGTAGDRIVELAACWTIILIVSGLYLWFPRKREKLWGSLLPRFRKGSRILVRDLHAVPAFWWSGGLIFFLLSGLLWSGFWGNGVQHLTTSSGAGYPPSIWIGEAPESDVKTEEVADVSWAAENLPVPDSEIISGYAQVSIDDVVQEAERLDVHPTYNVFYPNEPEGVFTLSTFPNQAQDEATVHIDQYTGVTIADYQFDDYGVIGKIMALGITMHKGLQFGIINQLFGLLICLGLIGIIFSGVWLWLRRKPKGNSGAPKSDGIIRYKVPFFILIILGVIFPLAGTSMVIIFLLDVMIIQRIGKLRDWFNADRRKVDNNV